MSNHFNDYFRIFSSKWSINNDIHRYKIYDLIRFQNWLQSFLPFEFIEGMNDMFSRFICILRLQKSAYKTFSKHRSEDWMALSLSLFGIKTSSCMTEKICVNGKMKEALQKAWGTLIRNKTLLEREANQNMHEKNWKPYMHGNKVKVLLGLPN